MRLEITVSEATGWAGVWLKIQQSHSVCKDPSFIPSAAENNQTSSTSFAISLSFLSKESRYGGMAQWMRDHAARAEDLGSIPWALEVSARRLPTLCLLTSKCVAWHAPSSKQ